MPGRVDHVPMSDLKLRPYKPRPLGRFPAGFEHVRGDCR